MEVTNSILPFNMGFLKSQSVNLTKLNRLSFKGDLFLPKKNPETTPIDPPPFGSSKRRMGICASRNLPKIGWSKNQQGIFWWLVAWSLVAHTFFIIFLARSS